MNDLTPRQAAILTILAEHRPAWVGHEKLIHDLPPADRKHAGRTIRTLTRRGYLVERGHWTEERAYMITGDGFVARYPHTGGGDRAA